MVELKQETWRSLMENAPNIILIVDQLGTIQYINRTVPGLTTDEVIGKNQYDFIELRHRDLVRETVERVFRTGKAGTYEIQGTGPDGRLSWYSTLVGPIKRNGEIVAVSLFTSDVTERKEAEEAFRKAKDELISRQSAAILELSTPIIQVWDEILVLPLIGPIDTKRARQIVNGLLGTIVETQSSVVIMDITGVPVVDTKVSSHFIKTVAAAKMLGAHVVITGISPHNAQALVKLGIDLGGITTKGTLQSALRLAFQMTGQRVVREQPEPVALAEVKATV